VCALDGADVAAFSVSPSSELIGRETRHRIARIERRASLRERHEPVARAPVVGEIAQASVAGEVLGHQGHRAARID
jgi:hypothetical protein